MERAPGRDEHATEVVSFTRDAVAGATAIFVVFGATAAVYGPLLVAFAHHFHVSLPAAGAVLSVHFAGALCGVPLGWTALRRYRGGAVLAGALSVMVLGATGAALARSFDELLISVAVIGLGFGCTDYSLNSLLVRTAEAGRGRQLSVVNAGYSIGAVLGPLLVIAARPANYPVVFAILALGALALTASTRTIGSSRLAPARSDAAHAPRWAVRRVFVAAYVLYVATESSAGGWIAPQLHGTGFSQSTGAITTAGFWLCLAAGRFLAGPVHRRTSDQRLVLVGLAVTAALALAASVTDLALAAYPLAGLSLALVYPMGLVWFTRLNPGDHDGLAILVLTMMAGGVIGPALTGAAVSVAGVRAVPVCVSLLAAADLAVFLVARRYAAAPPGPGPAHRADSSERD